MRQERATPRRSHPRGANSALVKPGYASISQIERERERRENFETGSMLAAMLLCVMFLVLSLGCWWFGW